MILSDSVTIIDVTDLTDIKEYYYTNNSTNPSSLPGPTEVGSGKWTEEMQLMTVEKPYLWTFSKTFADNIEIDSTDPIIIGNYQPGPQGPQGPQGERGYTGYSPTATVSKVNNVATITLTDQQGTTTAEIYDGIGTITDVKQNGVSVVESNIAKVVVPTKTSDLNNDSGFITDVKQNGTSVVEANTAKIVVPTKTSDLNNDSGFITDVKQNGVSVIDGNVAKVIVPTKTSDLNNDSGFISTYTETDPIFTASPANNITSTNINTWNGKQDELVSGVNIKEINATSLIGGGNITIQTKPSIQITILASDWNETTTCTKTVTGVTANNDIIVSPTPESMLEYTENGVYCSAQGNGTLTFTCSYVPTTSIVINVLIHTLTITSS